MTEFQVHISRERDYEFRVRFDTTGCPEMLVDAPVPVGHGNVPSPSRLLAAAIGHCLASGLVYTAAKAHVELGAVQATVRTELVRNERGLPRIGKVEVEIDPDVAPGDAERLARLTEVFQDVCLVSESVRSGIDIEVRVSGRRPE